MAQHETTPPAEPKEPAPTKPPPRRVYPLDPADLTAEQIAVTFAMTSRRPEPFDETAAAVSAARAADFNERWVVGYGHASVAEHAVLHLAVENISRIAADALEDNRLASYTEKSSRYQVMNPEDFHIPEELEHTDELRQDYINSCQTLFQAYFQTLDQLTDFLRQNLQMRPKETDQNYRTRIRRQAVDAARSLLPAATLTNVGVTANARTLEYAISKLLSRRLEELNHLGQELRQQGRKVAPILIKYAAASPYLADQCPPCPEIDHESTPPPLLTPQNPAAARLIQCDPQAPSKIAAALLYRRYQAGYAQALNRFLGCTTPAIKLEEQDLINQALARIGPHDPAPRELELADYLFELNMDYGAWREYRRHRLQSLYPQPLTAAHGWRVPSLIQEANLADSYNQAMTRATLAWRRLAELKPELSPYLVTHGHYQKTLAKLNARECWHLFQLRTSLQAHEAVREPVESMLRQAAEIHPELYQRLQLRHYPDWWPFHDRQ